MARLRSVREVACWSPITCSGGRGTGQVGLLVCTKTVWLGMGPATPLARLGRAGALLRLDLLRDALFSPTPQRGGFPAVVRHFLDPPGRGDRVERREAGPMAMGRIG